MTRILLVGCAGAMGQKVAELAGSRQDCVIEAGIDLRVPDNSKFPVFSSFEQCDADVDVIVDFSHPSLLSDLLYYARRHSLPVVLCATGYSDEQLAQINAATKEIPVFKSGNMSLGINLLISLVKKAYQVLGENFDIEITERHHNLKQDAPSGTALMIADALSDTMGTSPRYEYDRHSRRMRRPKDEIGIHSIRGGTIVGEHEVLFAGPNEEIIISHKAESKGVFAAGALSAAVFMCGKSAGAYDMDSLITEN